MLRNCLVGGQNLLDDNPWFIITKLAPCCIEPFKVLRRIGQTVDVVNAQSLNCIDLQQFKQLSVRQVKDRLVLDAHASQSGYIKEPPPIDAAIPFTPIHQLPVLLSQRPLKIVRRCPRSKGETMLVIAGTARLCAG